MACPAARRYRRVISTLDIAWVAGLLEGEGYFHFHKTARGPHIALSMTDRDVVEKAAVLLGSRVRTYLPRRPNRKPLYIFTSGRDIAGWMMTLYPLLGERRRAQIRGALSKWRARRTRPRYRHTCPRGHPLSPKGQTGWRHCSRCDREQQQRRRREHGVPVRRFRDQVPTATIPCGCGCGRTLTTPDQHFRPRGFLPGHNMRGKKCPAVAASNERRARQGVLL